MKDFDVNIKRLSADDHEILHDISLTISDGITVIAGKSGAGKTQFVRRLVPGLSQIGEIDGSVKYGGEPVEDIQPGTIGFISQNPDNQIVCDRVWHELAFGLESTGVKSDIIRNRVAEVATVFGIDPIFDQETDTLSGGQKQKVVLASVLCMNPDVVVMDEPSSMLDPIATVEFFELVVRLNRDLGVSFIIVEHNLDYILDFADRTIYIEDGTIVEKELKTTKQKLLDKLGDPKKPYEVKQIKNETNQVVYKEKSIRKSFGSFTLNIPSITLHSGITCIVGPNGAGKSTLAKYISGFYGKKKADSVSLLPQDVLMIFVKDSVREELDCVAEVPDYIREELEYLYDKHPLDISGGEQHLVALAKVMIRGSKLTFLDEPTKGMDDEYKERVKNLISKGFEGRDVVIITHDLEFVADVADEVIFMFGGDIASQGEAHDVLCNNTMYKPIISKMWEGALKWQEVKVF